MSESATDEALVRFGAFELDLKSGELRKAGLVLNLPPQPFKILVLLATHPGQLVTREEIQRQIWGSETFVDFEQGLNFAINKIRTTLGDEAGTPRYIETLPRRGYRFVAPIMEIKGPERDFGPENANAVIQARPEESPPIGNLRGTIAKLSLAVTLVVILVAASVWAWQKWRARSLQNTPHITSLVVLPLTNLSGDPSQDYFADGMTDELTTDLARISSLKVISETSAMRYRGTHPPLQQIAEELDVDAVIEGSVARSGDQVRITAQLIDVKNDRHLWAQSYDRHGIDVLGLQRDVARAITSQIHLKLTPAEASRLETLPTHNQQAYDAYLHAKYHVDSAIAVEADANAAIAEAEQAITLDPDFAKAYVVIAQGCFAKIFDWAGGKEYDEKAVVALGKALTLDANLADAYATRGALSYTRLHSFDVVSAVADYRRAISLNPNLAEAHQSLGAELTHVGLHNQAIEEFRMTLRLDPKNDGAKYRLGRALWQSQRFGEALQNYDRYNIVSFEKALTLAYLGRRRQAWETIDGVAQQLGRARRGGFGGDPEDVAAVRAFLYATEAKPQKAEREIHVAARLGKDNDHFHHAAFILAAACAEMGKPHEAVAWLSRVAGSGMPNYPLFRDNPSMSKLRGNSEFEEFMARLKPRWDQLAASL